MADNGIGRHCCSGYPANIAAKALKSINLDVMFFLFGMFIVGEALEDSGYLSYLSYRLFRRAKSLDSLVLFILFGMGINGCFSDE